MKKFVIGKKHHKYIKLVIAFVIFSIIFMLNINKCYGANTYTNDSIGIPPSNYVNEPDAKLTDYENAPIEVDYRNGLILKENAEVNNIETENIEGNIGNPINDGIGQYREIKIPFNSSVTGYQLQKNTKIRIKYNNIGTIKDKTTGADIQIGCIIELRDFYIYPTAPDPQRNDIVNIKVYENYKNGFSYCGMESVKAIYSFFVTGQDDKPISIHDTYFSVNSLTWNEGVAYIHDDFKENGNENAKAYINWNDYQDEQYNVKKKYITTDLVTYGEGNNLRRYYTFRGHGHATQNIKEEVEAHSIDTYYSNNKITTTNTGNYLLFDDWSGTKTLDEFKNGNWVQTERKSQDFDKGSVSFLLNDQNETSYTFVYSTWYKGKTEWNGIIGNNILEHNTWVAHSTTPLGLPKVDDPVKKSNKNKVVKGASFTYTIRQKLHEKVEGALRTYDHYTELALEDTLPKEVDFVASRIIIKNNDGSVVYSVSYNTNAENNNGKFIITNNTGQTKLTYQFKKSYLNNLPLEGQTLVWEIDCKVKSNIKDVTKFDNQAITNLGRVKYKSNKITIDIIPPVLRNTITKTAIGKAGTSFQNPNWITEKDDTIHYTITYTPTVQYYIGSATIELEDKLPYPLDEQKTSQEVLSYYNHDNNNPKLIWRVSYNDINSEPSYNQNGNPVGTPTTWTKTITKEIDLVYDIPKSALATRENEPVINLVIKNIANGKTTLASGENVNAEADYTILLNKLMKIRIQKVWKDSGSESDITNRQNLKWLSFVLYKNGTEITRRVLKTNQEIQNFSKQDIYMMRKYDENGNRIVYSLKEFAGGDENSIGEQLINTTEKKVTNSNKLFYYIDQYSQEEGTYFDEDDGGNVKVETFQTLTVTNSKTNITINGNVWKDSNKNGERDSEERKYPAIEVKLYTLTYPDGQNERTNEYRKVLTDSNGNYTFDNLPWNGTYRVVFAYI